jgi:acyl-CoA thioester hydrolase
MTEITVRVNYSEVDQMGVVYHARYLVWLDIARCEYIRDAGRSYADLERQGFRLAVGDLRIRYRQPARYDDTVRIRCWVREARSRRITFGYLLDLPERSTVLATAETAMFVLDSRMTPARLPPEVLLLLRPEPDPARLF